MKCPRCSSEMVARSVVSATDAGVRVTNNLCTACFKRVIVADRNPLLPLEYKLPTRMKVMPGIEENGGVLLQISTAAADTSNPL